MRLVVVPFVLFACAAPPADVPDASDPGAFDGGAAWSDASTADASVDDTPDAAAPDAGDDADAGESDVPDAGPDLACIDTAADAPGGCDYLDLDRVLLRCGDDLRFALGWSDHQRADCPAYWTLEGRRCGSLDAVIDQAACASGCRWVAHQSVSFRHCEGRTGYIVFRAWLGDERNPECPDQLEFSDGWYASFEDWEAKHPCPDAGSP